MSRPLLAARVVMGRRGEPETPDDPAQGKVWASIAAHAAVAAYRCWKCGAPHEAAPLQPDEEHLLDLLREAAP